VAVDGTCGREPREIPVATEDLTIRRDSSGFEGHIRPRRHGSLLRRSESAGRGARKPLADAFGGLNEDTRRTAVGHAWTVPIRALV